MDSADRWLAMDPQLRAEADRLLASGLRRVLDAYGDVHVVGSYALRLMVWRDLDVHIVRSDLRVGPFFDLGAQIAGVLAPGRMHFRNEIVMGTADLPRGLCGRSMYSRDHDKNDADTRTRATSASIAARSW